MRTFKDFIYEGKAGSGHGGSRSSPLTRERAIKLVKDRCEDAMKHDKPIIFRGVDAPSDYMFSTPGLHKRSSENTSNEYTTIIDNDPAWKDYPARSESLICTSAHGFRYATDYGRLHIVIPIDQGKKFACSSTQDFWFAFDRIQMFKIGETLDDFNIWLRNLFHRSERGFFDTGNTSYAKLKERMDITDDWIISNDINFNGLAKYHKEKFTLEEYTRWLLNPHANNIDLLSYDDLAIKSMAEAVEVWTDRDSVLLKCPSQTSFAENVEFYQQFRKEVLES